MSKLVIVESPSKAKTIKKYLGAGYDVTASVGHVRDLPVKRLGIDVKNDFAPKYELISGKEKLVDELKSAASKSDTVYLATDPDREGEAIAWHLAAILGIDSAKPTRVTFNEITKTGVTAGMARPRGIDLDLVNAQQARRILDRLVGYKLSPFVSQKIHRGLSAGRVQSVALRLIVDREEEIRAFKAEEYWTIDAKLLAPGSQKPFAAAFYGEPGKKIKITNAAQSDAILKELEGAAFTVADVKKGTRKKSPAPPFITSTLQQDASRRLGFQARRTMKAAQELYEGIDLQGTGAVGLITYMRTDSLRVSDEALNEARNYIKQKYGDKYLPEKPRAFKSKANAQDGHEAIRPTMPSLTPAEAKASLTPDQYKLYKLIWERFTASQMESCVQATVQADIVAGKYLFKASGYTVTFDGYTALYQDSSDDNNEDEAGGALPELNKDGALKCKELKGNQHFTQPPPRYTEASLIKTLEENGIGRPSTYAAILSNILGRQYVLRDAKQIKPTELGEVLTKLMKERFPQIVNVRFTAQMESELDGVEEGREDYISLLSAFYGDFEKTLSQAREDMQGVKLKLAEEETDIKCENCGRNMIIKSGRFGKFLACPGYPECKNTKPLVQETGALCPKCGAKIVTKKSKKGYTFYGCEGYPACDFATWDQPLPETCPKCGKSLFKKRGGIIHCGDESCGYERKAERKSKKKESEDEQ